MVRILLVLALVGASLSASLRAAQAADPVVAAAAPAPSAPDFDVIFGIRGVTDYNFRGISQTDRGPGVQGYVEAKYLWVYGGIAVNTVDLPTNPLVEVDLYGGIRPTWGPLTFDLGAMYYWYTRERALYTTPAGALVGFAGPGFVQATPRNTDMWEIYGKVSYTINDVATLGANLFYTPDWLGTSASGTYGSLTASVNLPVNLPVALQLSGELGRYWLGTQTNPGIVALPDYTYWNAGVSATFGTGSTIKFDLRYHDTDLSRANCWLLTSDPAGFTNGGRSRWCSAAIIGTISFDTSFSALGLVR